MTLQRKLMKRELGQLSSSLQPDRRWPIYQTNIREEAIDLICHSLMEDGIVCYTDNAYSKTKDLILPFKSSSTFKIDSITHLEYNNRYGVTAFVVTVISKHYGTFSVDFWCFYNKHTDKYEGNLFLSQYLVSLKRGCFCCSRTDMPIVVNLYRYIEAVDRRIALSRAYFGRNFTFHYSGADLMLTRPFYADRCKCKKYKVL